MPQPIQYEKWTNPLERAKQVLLANETIAAHGIFGFISACPYFPPREFLNEFLLRGSDPCDQDGLMGDWRPFTVSPEEYGELLVWWTARCPDVTEDALGVTNWNDWLDVIVGNTERRRYTAVALQLP